MAGLSDISWIIVFGALLTYATRVGGHIILSQFKTISPRVNAALNAVPAAVMTTLFAPIAVTEGWRETVTMILVVLVGLRFNVILMLLTALVSIVFLRNVL